MNKMIAIVPAAGVGSRMKADRPKQYLTLLGKTVLEHTIEHLLGHPQIEQVVVAISVDDPYFSTLSLAQDPRVIRVAGEKSVLIPSYPRLTIFANMRLVSGYWCTMPRALV